MSDIETVRAALQARAQSEWFVLAAFDRIESGYQELIAAAREVRYIGGLDRLRAALKNLEES